MVAGLRSAMTSLVLSRMPVAASPGMMADRGTRSQSAPGNCLFLYRTVPPGSTRTMPFSTELLMLSSRKLWCEILRFSLDSLAAISAKYRASASISRAAMAVMA